MPLVKADYELGEDEAPWPILWIAPPVPDLEFPDLSNETLELVFGPGKDHRLKSWGHDDDGVHWLTTRRGAPLHVDHVYTRYTHHLILRNDGWRLRGLSDDNPELYPPMVPGTMYCMDTHSPHGVVADLRMPQPEHPRYKVQLVVDRDEPLSPDDAWDLLLPSVNRPLSDFSSVPFVAPRAKKKKKSA